MHRVERVEGIVADRGERADIEIAPAAVLEGRQRRVLAKNVGRTAVCKRRGKSHPAGDLRHDPPIGLRLARCRQKSPLARDAPLGIGDGAVLLAPRGGGKENVCAGIHGVVGKDVLGDHEQIELLERLAHMACAWQRDRGIGGHHHFLNPSFLNPSAAHSLHERVDRQMFRSDPFQRRNPPQQHVIHPPVGAGFLQGDQVPRLLDHAQHLKGIESARPGKGCAACHSPANRGVAETIPARLNAHQVCYDCHSPGKQASKTSSCGSCHKLAPYSPTSTAARAYRVGFSHADHGPREHLTCDRCHSLRGGGLPQAKQVSSILPAQHYVNPRAQSCATCHNGRRSFGDKGPNFDDCKRCHKGLKFGA